LFSQFSSCILRKEHGPSVASSPLKRWLGIVRLASPRLFPIQDKQSARDTIESCLTAWLDKVSAFVSRVFLFLPNEKSNWPGLPYGLCKNTLTRKEHRHKTRKPPKNIRQLLSGWTARGCKVKKKSKPTKGCNVVSHATQPSGWDDDGFKVCFLFRVDDWIGEPMKHNTLYGDNRGWGDRKAGPAGWIPRLAANSESVPTDPRAAAMASILAVIDRSDVSGSAGVAGGLAWVISLDSLPGSSQLSEILGQLLDF
jgi:hypothetical protein